MPTRKIAPPPPPPCRHPEHKPPSMRVFEPGTYVHTCPGCGVSVRFTVPWITWGTLSRHTNTHRDCDCMSCRPWTM